MEEDIRSHAIFLFFICLFSTFLIHTFFSKGRRPRRIPPSPMALPIIGHFHLLSTHPHQSLHHLSKNLGPFFQFRLGSVPHVVASSADVAKEFLKTHEQFFSHRPITRTLDYLNYGTMSFVTAPYGPYWKFMKKLCMSELLGSRVIEQFKPFRREEMLRFLQLLRQKSENCEAIDLSKELKRVTNNVISCMAMSRRCSGSEEEAEAANGVIDQLLEVTAKPKLWDFIGFCKYFDLHKFDKKLTDAHWRYDEMMEGILNEKEEARKKMKMGVGDDSRVRDILDILLDINEDENAEIRLTRDNIKAFIQDLFVAGTDTSSLTTEWAMAELINHPRVLKKAREEIDAVVEKTRLVQESDIPNLPYIQAIMKETLRLHPVLPLIARKSIHDCEINGCNIPGNTALLVNVWAIGRDPAYWKDPPEFCPERFMENEDGNAIGVRGQHFHFLPFGSGRRMCPGASLALQVVQSTVAAMVQCFELKVESGVPVDMTEGISLTMPRAKPLVCIPVARLDPLPLP